MNDENDSNSHELDGCDPDVPQNRSIRGRFSEAVRLVDDLQELRQMDETDINRYAGGSRHNSISRGR